LEKSIAVTNGNKSAAMESPPIATGNMKKCPYRVAINQPSDVSLQSGVLPYSIKSDTSGRIPTSHRVAK
jgi:hypothetical protein